MKFRKAPLRNTLASIVSDGQFVGRGMNADQVRVVQEDGQDHLSPGYKEGSITIWLEGLRTDDGAYLVNLTWLSPCPKVHRLLNGVYTEITENHNIKRVCELALDVANSLPESLRGLGFNAKELDTDRIRQLLNEFLWGRFYKWDR